MTQAIQASAITKSFVRKGGEKLLAVNNLDLSVAKGEFVVLVGPSGCGKTTLLRCLAGLETPDTGSILLENQLVFESRSSVYVPPERRKASMLFQSYALWPHMTVFDNVSYPLRTGGQDRSSDRIRELTMQILDKVGCSALADQYPNAISGGQQQRVALARALVRSDPLVFFDEPLSNIDAKLRAHLRKELKRLQTEIGFAAIYVTHDQLEALELGDRIMVLNDGSVAQEGSPSHIYQEPVSPYVADFMGTTNHVKARVARVNDGGIDLESPFGSIHLRHLRSGAIAENQTATLITRPSSGIFSAHKPVAPIAAEVSVLNSVFLGTHTELTLSLDNMRYLLWVSARSNIQPGTRGWLSLEENDLLVFPDATATDLMTG